ncbi:YjcQ family protein [Enterococcus devriesei]|uniref:YjcQ family protein n=1 Tax=Enterococcus devriesei TaxID=319970 RepID=UPI0028E848B1|nr:YjcQ family protein [Enterococcus devriesei]
MDKKKLRYAILKELDSGNKNINEATFGISQEEFKEQVDFLVREGYISKPMYADNIVYSMSFVNVKEKGEDYLSTNSSWSKLYAAAKEIRDWVK